MLFLLPIKTNRSKTKKTIPNVSYHHRKAVCKLCKWNINEFLINVAAWYSCEMMKYRRNTIAAAINLSFDILKVAFVFIHGREYGFYFRHNCAVCARRVHSHSCIQYTALHVLQMWEFMKYRSKKKKTECVYASRQA